MYTGNLPNLTRRPASADRTARRQFQATGQPVNRTQASDAMTSRLPVSVVYDCDQLTFNRTRKDKIIAEYCGISYIERELNKH